MKRLRTTRRAKPKPKAIVAVVSFPGRAKSGSDTEWRWTARRARQK